MRFAIAFVIAIALFLAPAVFITLFDLAFGNGMIWRYIKRNAFSEQPK